MSNECSNHLVVVGPNKSLARFKRETCKNESQDGHEVDLCMDIQGPLSEFYDIDREVQSSDSDWVCDASLKYIDSETGYGCLNFDFITPWEPPIEFVSEASTLFPTLEIHLKYLVEGDQYAGKVTYIAGIPFNEVKVDNIDPDECLKKYLKQPKPDPWKDGLFENPDSLKPNQSAVDSQAMSAPWTPFSKVHNCD